MQLGIICVTLLALSAIVGAVLMAESGTTDTAGFGALIALASSFGGGIVGYLAPGR